MKGKKLFLYSLGSLAILSSSAVFAQEIATAPTLEGGWSAMVGTFYALPSTSDNTYAPARNLSFNPDGSVNVGSYPINVDNDYDFGFKAGFGYVLPGTANSIDLSYRSFSSTDDDAASLNFKLAEFIIPAPVNDPERELSSSQKNKYEDWDLMFSQFLDIGRHVQMRFSGGLSYLSELSQTKSNFYDVEYFEVDEFTQAVDLDANQNSNFSGLGPRIGADARYDFGDLMAGFGIVGGFSVAYLLGDMDSTADAYTFLGIDLPAGPDFGIDLAEFHAANTNENHSVTNLRGNLGVDYVYFFDNENKTTLGIEIGYEVDSYINGISQISAVGNNSVAIATDANVSDITFQGPYADLKMVF